MKKITSIVLFLGFIWSAQAQTLNEYLVEASANNTELKAYFNEYLASLEKVPQVGTLPDPTLSFGIFIQPMDRLMGTQRMDIQVMQMFPWFGMLKTRKNEASQMALARYEVFRNAKNNLHFQVKNSWYQLYELQERIRISEENLEILRAYERLALVRFESATGKGSSANGGTKSDPSVSTTTASGQGMGSSMNQTNSAMPSSKTGMNDGASMTSSKSGMGEVLRIRMEIKELENELKLLKSSKAPLEAEFNQWLSRKFDEPVSVSDTLSVLVLPENMLVILDSISSNNPMLRMLDAEENAYEAQRQMARLDARPMLGAGLNYVPLSPRNENGMQMGGQDMIMPMVTLSLPIYQKKYKAKAKEADLLMQSVQLRREAVTNQLTTQWTVAIRDLEDATRRTTFYKEQSALANQTLNVLLASYATDGSEFEDILNVRRQLLDYQLKYIQSIINQHRGMALLDLLAASQLD